MHEHLRQTPRESSSFYALDRPPRGGNDMDPSEPVMSRLVDRGGSSIKSMITT